MEEVHKLLLTYENLLFLTNTNIDILFLYQIVKILSKILFYNKISYIIHTSMGELDNSIYMYKPDNFKIILSYLSLEDIVSLYIAHNRFKYVIELLDELPCNEAISSDNKNFEMVSHLFKKIIINDQQTIIKFYHNKLQFSRCERIEINFDDFSDFDLQLMSEKKINIYSLVINSSS